MKSGDGTGEASDDVAGDWVDGSVHARLPYTGAQ